MRAKDLFLSHTLISDREKQAGRRRRTHLLDVSTRRPVGEIDLEPQPALNDTKLSGLDHQVAEFSLDVEAALLGDDEHVAAGGGGGGVPRR